MIIKEKIKSKYILQLEALVKRLPQEHPKQRIIQEVLAKQKAGYYGERSLDYYLSFLSKEKYLILHNLRFQGRSSFFQIDILLLSPFFFLILEVKNISGMLLFDPTFQQLIRTLDGKEEAFPYPIHQVERQNSQMKAWLSDYNYPIPPIENLIIISNPQTIIKSTTDHKQISQVVLHSTGILKSISTLEKKYSQEIYSPVELKKLGRHLTKKNTPTDVNLLEQFQLTREDILKGVSCPKCITFSMNRYNGIWKCLSCSHESKEEHIVALKEYALLFGDEITSRTCADFLQLRSKVTAKRLLQRLKHTSTGSTKSRCYKLLL